MIGPDRTGRARGGRAWMVALGALLVLAAALRLAGIALEPVWLDEAASLNIARSSPAYMSRLDIHPIGYYLLLHLWVRLGDSEAVLRSLSVLLALLTIPVIYRIGRSFGSRRLALVATLLFVTAPFQIRWAQEARMYALLTLGASVAILGMSGLLLRDSREGGGEPLSIRAAWLCYAGGAAVMLYAHHIAVLFLATANLIAAALGSWWLTSQPLSDGPWWRKWDPVGRVVAWVTAQLGVLILWAPGIPAFLRHSRRIDANFWVPSVSVARIGEVVNNVFLGGGTAGVAIVAALVFGLLVVAGARGRGRGGAAGWALVALIATPLLLEILVSLRRPVLLDRTLIWTGIPFCLLLARGIERLARPRLRTATIAVVVALQLVGVGKLYLRDDHPPWDRAAAFVSERVQDDDLVVFVAAYISMPFNYYFGPDSARVEQMRIDPAVMQQGLGELGAATREHGGAWLVLAHQDGTDPDGEVQAILSELGATTQEETFGSIGIFRYEVR